MKTKSNIIQTIIYDINTALASPQSYNRSGEETERRTGKTIKWTIQIQEPESMIDENGIKWVRVPIAGVIAFDRENKD